MNEHFLNLVWLLVTLISGLISGGLQVHGALVPDPLSTEAVVMIGGPFGLILLIGIVVCFARFPLKALGVFALTWPTLFGPYLILSVMVGCFAFGQCI